MGTVRLMTVSPWSACGEGEGEKPEVSVEANPYEVVLELARAQNAGDPYGFHDVKPQEYRLRVGEGGLRCATFPWSERVLADLEALAGRVPDAVAARRLGEDIRGFLDALDWGGHEETLERHARSGRAVRLVLRSSAAELYSLPWELVTLKDSGQHLADIPGFSLRYEWPREHLEVASLGEVREGRVLMAWSEAGGAVPDERHQEALLKASLEGGFGFDPRRDVLPRVSLEGLERTLSAAREAREPVSVLHLLCHGTLVETPTSSHFGLAWNAPGDSGGKQWVDAGALAAALAPYRGTLRLVVLCACHGGDGGRLASHLGSMAQELHRAGIEMVVASRLPMTAEGSVLLARTLYEKLLVDSRSLEEALAAARRRLRVEAKGFDWASLQLYARGTGEADLRPVVLRPYRGLLPFGPKNRRFFFGRSRLEAELLARVDEAGREKRPRFQVVAGASGAGKSSVVMAGLVPRLPAETWDVVTVRPTELGRPQPKAAGVRSEPLRELRQRLHRVWDSEPLPDGEGAQQQDVVAEARRLRQARPDHKLLLVVDQLEEVFTHLEGAERQALMRALWALTRTPELECVVVATLRVDAFERCGEVALDDGTRLDAVVYSEAHRVFVAQLGPEELVEAIEKPARRVGLELEAGLVDRLCRDVGQEPGALPLLEHALDLLWQGRDGNRLTHRMYAQMEGVAGALTRTAERLYDTLAEDERQQARRLREELIALGDESTPDSRRRVWLEDIRPEEPDARAAFDRMLEKMVTARLLIRGSETEGAGRVWLEVAHEALIRRWQRLRGWLRENRKRLLRWRELQAMAETWHAHRRDPDGGVSYLATGARLRFARLIRDEHQRLLTAPVRDFLVACEAREYRRGLRRWLTRAGTLVGMALCVAVALSEHHQRAELERRLSGVVDVVRRLHFKTEKLAAIAGTAEVREDIGQEVERLLTSLGATQEPGILIGRIITHMTSGDAALMNKDLARARAEYSQALELATRLRQSDPDRQFFTGILITIHSMLEKIAHEQGQLAEAHEHHRVHDELAEELLRADPANAALLRDLAPHPRADEAPAPGANE
ncbi:CHAT domain-containing protein [Myxococcus sp. RHSTA-1-4]|uniref:nSTAND1 domain-containing NTPase n=1 Tax=Myxococcus sp. RHSTA-1-4 TaxID=2874601 RepID=UPI001CBCA5A0|nr:CHAT domain-containing protein [Myxococcus sp. RHSTA-1-4]MBZ4414975.1 CHAT domain-containing protein [Myxococcus sp. RHSTA-1-4]